MENKKVAKLIDSIINNLDTTGINTDTLIEDIKVLRNYPIDEEIPLAVKVLRYTYEHIEEHNSFLIPIPEDSPIDDEDSEELETAVSNEVDPIESLKYLILLIKNLHNKMNILDLKYYKEALMAY